MINLNSKIWPVLCLIILLSSFAGLDAVTGRFALNKDYYGILEIPRTADAEEIKKAFWKLSKKYHPDIAQDKKTAEEKFKEINEAYEVLRDPGKRKAYDEGSTSFAWQSYSTSKSTFKGPTMSELFADFFGDILKGSEKNGFPLSSPISIKFPKPDISEQKYSSHITDNQLYFLQKLIEEEGYQAELKFKVKGGTIFIKFNRAEAGVIINMVRQGRKPIIHLSLGHSTDYRFESDPIPLENSRNSCIDAILSTN